MVVRRAAYKPANQFLPLQVREITVNLLWLSGVQPISQQINFLPLQVREITVNLLWLSGVQPLSRIDIVCFCCPKESMLCLNLYCFIEKEKDKTKQQTNMSKKINIKLIQFDNHLNSATYDDKKKVNPV